MDVADESKRELILQNLKSALEGIDGDDPYWTEIKTVRRVPAVPTDFEGEEKPALLIIATGGSEDIENQHGYHDRRTMKVGIVGVMDRPADDEGAALNRLMQDVGIAAMADQTRGGYASATFKTFQVDHSNLFGDLCLFETELAIRYHVDGRTEQ
jgi:hypothetical protein